MECKNCNGRDFDVVIPNLSGSAYIECSNCRQGYTVLEKLNLWPTEIVGDLSNNPDDVIRMTCGKCRALRYVRANDGQLIKSTQICNRCVEEILASDSNSVTEPAGAKISWEDFVKSVIS